MLVHLKLPTGKAGAAPVPPREGVRLGGPGAGGLSTRCGMLLEPRSPVPALRLDQVALCCEWADAREAPEGGRSVRGTPAPAPPKLPPASACIPPPLPRASRGVVTSARGPSQEPQYLCQCEGAKVPSAKRA
mmetsp:Transcript_47117/g.132879  ORF Transcript_47117/g.132879 Transcript_47117/m.132879 type:complete len:132 (-) Transcript_47117:3-398(-)